MPKDAAEQILGDLIDKDTTYSTLLVTLLLVVPDGDTGITGRKIIVDTYGGYAPMVVALFSGKIPRKVDRLGLYGELVSKNVVADDMADWCLIQPSYAIGVKEPHFIYVDL